MKEKRYIVDTTLRDGEQSPFVHLTSTDKISIAKILDQAGIFQIEAGVSAMGNSEMETMYQIINQTRKAKVSIWSRLHPDDVKKAIECKPDVVHVSIPVSYLHIYKKLGKNKSWILKMLYEILDIISGSGCDLSIGFEDASRADFSFIVKLAAILEQANTKMLRFADTVGISSPFAIREMITYICEFTSIPIEIHAHNDLGMAVANTAEAVKSGAIYADTTLLGVGERCGNCKLSSLVKLILPIYDLDINEQMATDAENFFMKLTSFGN